MQTTITSRLEQSLLFILLLYLIFAATSANAGVLRIDAEASAVRHTPLQFICPIIGPCEQAPARDFSIAGDISLSLTHQYLDFGPSYGIVDRTLIKLVTSNLVSEALDEGFFLDQPYGVLGLLSGSAFAISDDPCFLFVGPGSCTSFIQGTRTGSVGTWDGRTLRWTGSQYTVGVEQFEFSIVAAAVPTPGTIVLILGPALLVLARVRFRRVVVSPCGAGCR